MGCLPANTLAGIQEAKDRILADEEETIQLSVVRDRFHRHGSHGLRHMLQLHSTAIVLR